MNRISVVVGSWGSYNECNERALGSEWLDFDDYDDWDDILEELQREGFDLDGTDKELFIQDIEGIEDRSTNWDYVNPREIFELVKKSGILCDEYKYSLFESYLEAYSFDEWKKLVKDYEEDWDIDLVFYRNKSLLDVAYEIIEECYDLDKLLGNLAAYFDYDAFARDLSYDGYTETKNGVFVV